MFPPEDVHYFSMNTLKKVCSNSITKTILEKSFKYDNSSLNKNVFGLDFKNPVGLGAGFDKNAVWLTELEALGFGYVEIGTVTPQPQPGNDKPRLFRLPADKALINRMGFNNNGAKAIAGRLRNWHEHKKNSSLIVGGNIGKNKITANEEAWKDYEICFNELHDCVDYFVVNVSSPNTPGLRALQEKNALSKILSQLQHINAGKRKQKPLLLKISPDLSHDQLEDIASLALELKLDGLVAANTTIAISNINSRNAKLAKMGTGGISGKPLRQCSTEIVKKLSSLTNNTIPIIASGGIFTAKDAKEKINSGASLVQVWTGFVYEGPGIVKNICKGLIG